MPRILLFFAAFGWATVNVSGQTTDTTATKRIGFIGIFENTYNFQDKVLGPGLGRKWAAGLSFTNKKRDWVVFAGVGIKGAKINVYSPQFRESFIEDVQQNYVPIPANGIDSVIGAKMNSSPGKDLYGTYAQYAVAGFMLNQEMRPVVTLYIGNEEYLLHDGAFYKYEDPKYNDIDYVGMSTTVYELKVGLSLPQPEFLNFPFAPHLNIGYKWVDYGSLKFKDTPLSAYTTGSLADKYRFGGKVTVGISFLMWSNWK